ncbi:hypothetical protein HDF26_003600 [Pedobacter cryoconitis]|uniref:phage/plasmid replication domain-containing protein n=1 Tax=Pedobacter cryoconitis TaxID=188932 RepID=UPI00160FF030|nr:phage/plasmid replication protein [Pedobacter cryoconitis]MBB6273140.1 hypothetical protein [Pedobacter cryoconitis]
MIDTIKIKIPKEELPDNYNRFLENILQDKEEIRKDNGLFSLKGKLSNFRVSVNDRELVIEGSLTKYAIGDNLHTADKEQLEQAIYSLGNILNIDLQKGKVTRLDIAGNIITKYPVEEYYQLLIDLNRLKRKDESNGLSFGNNSRYLSFYGKITEMKRRRDIIDDTFGTSNILRYEYRYSRKKSLSEFLKISNPTVEDIFKNYDHIISSWVHVFALINKKRDFLEPPEDLFSKRGEFDKFLKRKGIEALGGTKEVLGMIEIAKRRKYLNKYPNEASNLKKTVKTLMGGPPDVMQKSTLVQELEEKIELVSFCTRSHHQAN